MEKSQEQTLRTLVLILVVFFVILDYGTADEDKEHAQDLTLPIPVPKVAMMTDQRLRRRHRDVGQNNPHNCYPDEYYSTYYRQCKGCTRCSPGTQHDPQEFCGNGQGQELHCIPCEDGYFQPKEGITVRTCQLCSSCDPHATIEEPCSLQQNTVCGKCQKGWYYNEAKICVECTERDMSDPSNQECYVKPKTTPRPNLPDPEPQSSRGPNLNPSTIAPVPRGEGPPPKLLHNPQNENALGRLEIGLICGACLVLVFVGFLIYFVWKCNKEKDVPPAVEEHEMNEKENLYHVEDEESCQQRPGPGPCRPGPSRPGPSGHSPGDAVDKSTKSARYTLVPPSSHENSSQPTPRGSSAGTDVDPNLSQGGEPTLNYVTVEGVPLNDQGGQDEPLTGPRSMPRSLHSFHSCGLPEDPARPQDVQSPGKVVDPNSHVTCNETATGRNYDVVPDESVRSEIGSLSSQPQHNIPR
ncbi:uncharacterized protein LOC121429707 isoform X2 [Lytechinus variegatus]|nr:uncharacterized protein LOC121429707 isoform X2 [Lytechinus variegatus]